MKKTSENTPVVSTWDWFFTLLILAIPIVNIIMYLYWALGGGNPNKVTYCRAVLLWLLVSAILALIVVTIAVVTGVTIGGATVGT